MVKNIALLLVLAFSLSLISCDENKIKDGLSSDLINNPVTAGNDGDLTVLPKFKFKTTEHDFGNVIDGVKVAYKFRFTNVGGSDLVINQVKTSCGCTVSRFPKQAIKPGESNFIEITFDSSRRKGFNHKNATVLANTQPSVVTLNIKAMVQSADEL